MIRIKLASNLNLESIPRMGTALRPGMEAAGTGQAREIEINLERLAFVSAAPLAVLTAAVLKFVRAPRVQLGFVPPRNSDVNDYLARMDFYDLARQPVRYRWRKRPSEGRLQEPIEVGSVDRCHEPT